MQAWVKVVQAIFGDTQTWIRSSHLCTAASCCSASSWIMASTLNLKGCCPKFTDTHSPVLHTGRACRSPLERQGALHCMQCHVAAWTYQQAAQSLWTMWSTTWDILRLQDRCSN